MQGAGPGTDRDLLEALIAREKPVHAPDVRFVQARSWGPVSNAEAGAAPQPRNSKEVIVNRSILDLNEPGTGSASGFWYRELAYMVNWPLGRYGRFNRPQFLRKYLHTQSTLVSLTDVQAEGAAVLPAIPALQTYADAVTTVSTPTVNYLICTPEGRQPIGPGTRYPYLEHHQLGR